MEFRVWAPSAARVDVDLPARRIAMTQQPGGWWSARVDDATANTGYAFSIDGESPLPDPRSEWQPFGVPARRGA